jgi:hypothetical protein
MRALPSVRSNGPSSNANQPAAQRPIYVVVLRPERGIDGVRALRNGLKYLLRACGLRALSVREGGA